jgi:hypothetical protein
MSKESFRSSCGLYVSVVELYVYHRTLHVSWVYTGSFGFKPVYLSRTSCTYLELSSYCSSSSIDA